MADENDPAVEQEGAADGSTTVTDPQVTEDAAEASAESEAGTDNAPKEETPAPADELEIVVESASEDEEPTPKDTAAWVKMRQERSALKAELAEQKRRLRALENPSQAEDPGPEPTLEDCDFSQEAYKAKLRAWDKANERKAAHDAQAAQQAEVIQRTNSSKYNEYLAQRDQYSKTVPNYLEAESVVKAALDGDRQQLILRYAKNPALVVGALGRMPKLLEDLAKQSDFGRFIATVSELETQVKAKKKTPQAPPPERPVRGTGSKSGSVDSQLERLRAEADRTGNRTPVIKYLRDKRKAS